MNPVGNKVVADISVDSWEVLKMTCFHERANSNKRSLASFVAEDWRSRQEVSSYRVSHSIVVHIGVAVAKLGRRESDRRFFFAVRTTQMVEWQ